MLNRDSAFIFPPLLANPSLSSVSLPSNNLFADRVVPSTRVHLEKRIHRCFVLGPFEPTRRPDSFPSSSFYRRLIIRSSILDERQKLARISRAISHGCVLSTDNHGSFVVRREQDGNTVE